MAASSSSWLDMALRAKQTATLEGDTIKTLITGYAPIPPCMTFMKYHEILSPQNQNMAEDIDANPGALALTHVVCLQCKEKVSVKDIGQKNKQSLEKRLRQIWQGHETMPMKRHVKCTSCSAPRTPIQDLNEHCQKHGYELHMSMQMLVEAPDFATNLQCHWTLGQSEATAKQNLACCMLNKVIVEEDRTRAEKKRRAVDVDGQNFSDCNRSFKQNPEIDEWMSVAGSESD